MKNKLIFVVVPTAILLSTLQVHARVNTLSGGASAGYDWSDREYETAEGRDDDYSRLHISPFIKIVSETPRDSAEVKYELGFLYDLDDNETDVDHLFLVDYMRMLTKNWMVNVSNELVNSDQFNSFRPTAGESSDEEVAPVTDSGSTSSTVLDDKAGRRRYTRNTLDLNTVWTYAEESHLTAGYVYSILRNDEDEGGASYEDYDRHDLSFGMTHRLTNRWAVLGTLGYTRGLYESVDGVDSTEADTEAFSDSDDVKEYQASLAAQYDVVRHHLMSLTYAFTESDYDSEARADSQIHDVTLGWQWEVSSKLDIGLGAGPTYSKLDGSSGDWDLNGNGSLRYKMEKGSFSLSAAAGRQFDNFSGTGERNTIEYWETRASLSYQPLQYTTIGLYAYYRNEDSNVIADTAGNEAILDQLQNGQTTTDMLEMENENTEISAVGCNLTYKFAENYSADFAYDFVTRSSDDTSAEYDEHKFVVSVSYENDFLRW